MAKAVIRVDLAELCLAALATWVTAAGGGDAEEDDGAGTCDTEDVAAVTTCVEVAGTIVVDTAGEVAVD